MIYIIFFNKKILEFNNEWYVLKNSFGIGVFNRNLKVLWMDVRWLINCKMLVIYVEVYFFGKIM